MLYFSGSFVGLEYIFYIQMQILVSSSWTPEKM